MYIEYMKTKAITEAHPESLAANTYIPPLFVQLMGRTLLHFDSGINLQRCGPVQR